MTRKSKTIWRSLPSKSERIENYFEGTKKTNKIDNNESVKNKNQSASTLSSISSEATVQTAVVAQPNVWNNNETTAVNQLFPEVVKLAKEEDEQLFQALAESVCTAQQDNEKRQMVNNNKIQAFDNDNDDEWGKKSYRNLPNQTSVDSTNCTKGSVDKYGRVDGGYTGKHLFMCKGGRRMEQKLIEEAYRTESNNSLSSKKEILPEQRSTNKALYQTTQPQASKQDNHVQNKTQEGPTNQRPQDIQSQSSQASKKDTPLSSKTQEGSGNLHSNKDAFKEKSGFNQNLVKNRRRGSAPKLETKSDSSSIEKNQQSSRNEKREPKEKSGFGKDESRNSQQQQKGQIISHEIKTERVNVPRGQLPQQNIKAEGHKPVDKQEMKVEQRGQKQKSAPARFQDTPKDIPIFNPTTTKDPYAALRNQDQTQPPVNVKKLQDNNKNQQLNSLNRCNQTDNKNQDNYIKQQSNSDRYDSKKLESLNRNQSKDQHIRNQNSDNYNRNQNQDRSMRNSGQDYSNKNQTQDYFTNRNQNQDRSLRNSGQDFSNQNQSKDYFSNRNQFQDRFGKNHIQDQFDKYQNQDNFNKNRGQDRFDKNQNQDNSNRYQGQDHFSRTQNQEQNKNQSSFGRFQEHSSKNVSDRTQINKADHQEYCNRNQTYDRFNESRSRDQDRYNRTQDFGKESKDSTNRSQDQFQKAYSEDKKNEAENSKSRLSLQGDKFNEFKNRNQDRYCGYQESNSKYQDNANRIQDTFKTTYFEDNTKSKPSSQKTSDSKNQQQSVATYNQRGYYSQESSNLKNYAQYPNTNYQENKVVANKQIDAQIQTNINTDKLNINTIMSRNNTTSTTQSINNSISSLVSSSAEVKHPADHSILNAVISHSISNTTEPSTLITNEIKKDYKEGMPKAETHVTFSHVHESSTCEPRPNVVLAFEGNQNVQRALGFDVNASHTVQSVNSQLAAYTNSIMNVNALPFEASNLNAQQGLNFPLADPAISVLPFVFPPNVSNAEAQRMNEISNLSQEMFRCANTVASLTKQLQLAQADLLAIQAKLTQYQNQTQSDNVANSVIQAENPSLPANFFTMHYIAPPGFTTDTPTIQKVQPDVFPFTKNYLASNVQQDLASDINPRSLLYTPQEGANFQQYSTNVSSTSGVPRERIVPQSQSQLTKGRELRGCGSQFYN